MIPLLFTPSEETVSSPPSWVPPVVVLDLAAVLRMHHTPVTRVDILGADLDTVDYRLDGRFLDGSVTTDRSSDTFSSASLQTLEDSAELTALLTPNRPVRVSRGAMVNGVPVLKALITGILTEPARSLASGALAFSVASRFAIAQRQFTGPTTIAAGVRGKDALRTLLELGGLGTSDALYDLDDGGYVVPVARTFDTNDEILGVAIKWAFDMACELWPDGNGVARMRPFIDPAAATPTWDFLPDPKTLLSLDRTLRGRQLYNRQTVYGRGPDGYTVKGEAVVTNPSDPLFWTPENDLPAPPYTSTDITTATGCVAVAQRMLFEAATVEESFDGQAVPAPLSARDVIGLSGAGYPDNFLLDRVSVPARRGAMRFTTRRSRVLSA